MDFADTDRRRVSLALDTRSTQFPFIWHVNICWCPRPLCSFLRCSWPLLLKSATATEKHKPHDLEIRDAKQSSSAPTDTDPLYGHSPVWLRGNLTIESQNQNQRPQLNSRLSWSLKFVCIHRARQANLFPFLLLFLFIDYRSFMVRLLAISSLVYSFIHGTFLNHVKPHWSALTEFSGAVPPACRRKPRECEGMRVR